MSEAAPDLRAAVPPVSETVTIPRELLERLIDAADFYATVVAQSLIREQWQPIVDDCKAARALLSAPQEPVSKWLPMNSAPRDGTWFLSRGALNNINGVSFCSWRPKDCPKGWYVYGPFGDCCDGGMFITGWMPLPNDE